jgi:hypothetical protein
MLKHELLFGEQQNARTTRSSRSEGNGMQYVNRAKHLVFLPLNTGDTIHLAPGEVSRNLEAYEADRNARIERLVSLGVIRAVPEPRPTKPPAKSATSKT